jgi:hypothetical protein
MPVPLSQSRHSTRSLCYSHRCIPFPDVQSGCLLQSAAPFHPRAPACSYPIKGTVTNRCDASCCIHRLASPESSPLAPSQLVAPHSSFRVLATSVFSQTATRSSFRFFANYHSNHPSSSTYRLVSHWDYLMYGPALHTVITCATAPHSRKAQGCIRSATTQLSNVICGTDSLCRGRQ